MKSIAIIFLLLSLLFFFPTLPIQHPPMMQKVMPKKAVLFLGVSFLFANMQQSIIIHLAAPQENLRYKTELIMIATQFIQKLLANGYSIREISAIGVRQRQVAINIIWLPKGIIVSIDAQREDKKWLERVFTTEDTGVVAAMIYEQVHREEV